MKKTLGCLLILLIAGTLAFAGSLLFHSCSSSDLPEALKQFTDLSSVKLPEDSNPSRIYSADGTELGQVNMEDRVFVAIDAMPDCLPDAFVAIEDERFYRHGGIDPRGIARAIWKAVSRGKAKEGASTITMQLARNLYLTQEKTLKRKTVEALIATELEKKYTKDEILEAYMNLIYFGHGAYGVGAASDVFFGKPVQKLSNSECALLAAVVKGPAVYSPFINMDNALARRNLVLTKMRKSRFIDDQELAVATAEPMRLVAYKGPYENYRAPFFVDYVIHQLTGESGAFGFSARELATGGEAARRFQGRGLSAEVIANAKQAAADNPLVHQGAFVALDVHTGAVVAMVGGADSKTSRYNRAWLSERQAGSSFKPFVYLTALMQGRTMQDTVENGKYCIGRYCPKNYGGGYGDGALVTLHEALVKSMNIPAVRVGHEAGESRVIRLCRDLGINSDMEASAPLALGTASISPLKMATAYAAIANGGHRVEPYAVNVIRDAQGQVIYKKQHKLGPRVLGPGAVRQIVPAMEDVIRRGTGTAARIGRTAAGKTGTTSSSRDAWFVGFTPDIAAAAWIGNDDNAPLCPPNSHRGCITGGLVPAALWRDVMKHTTRVRRNFDLPYDPAAETEAVDPATIELTGETATDTADMATPSVQIELRPVDENTDREAPFDPPDSEDNSPNGDNANGSNQPERGDTKIIE